VDIRVIDQRDEPSVRRHWEIGRAAEAERPYDFYVPWDLAWATYTEGRDDVEMVLLGAYDADGMWGAARVDLNRYDNTHLGSATYYTHPDRRRRGIGRALAEASYDVARSRGCSQLVTEAYAPSDATSPGLLFGEAMGFAPAIVDGMKVVDLVDTEHLWAALEEKVRPRHADYRILGWGDRVPDEILEGYCRLNEMFFEQAPMGELDMEPEKWDEDRVRKREARNARTGRHDLSAGAVAPDGRLVAFTEVLTSDSAPTRGIQSGTLVDPDHRGHALGLAIKLRNHRQIREQRPGLRVLLTGNADVNAAMNAVNDVLGYQEVERCIEMQRDLPA
jgi:GNAT superfamily N-acetyltransferase